MPLDPLQLPPDLLYDPEADMWVREQDGVVTVGATAFGLFRAGEVIAFTAKPRGAEVARGRGLGTVECAKTVLAVHAPVSMVLDAINENIEERVTPLLRDPYGDGWMVRGRAPHWAAECVFLVDANTYQAEVARRLPLETPP